MKKVISIILTATMIMLMIPQMVWGANDYHEITKEDLKLQWPIKTDRDYYITGVDYYKEGGKHNGIDIGHSLKVGYTGEDIYSVADGKVWDWGNSCSHDKGDTACRCGGRGNFIVIQHETNGKKYYSRYLHLLQNSIPSNLRVKGAQVTTDMVIGKMGNSGETDGSHLHFDIATAYDDTAATKLERGYTFDYYINNPSALKKVRFASSWTNSSGAKKSAYWGWITKNSERINGDYLINTCDHNYDPQTETCTNCKEKFNRQYENVNKTCVVVRDKSIRTAPYADYSKNVKSLKKGDTVTVKRKFQNVYGNVWCEVQKGNKTGYMYFGDVSNLNISSTSYPTTIMQGKTFNLKGTVTSCHNLTGVSGYIMSSDGKTIIQGSYDKQNIKTVNINTSIINKELMFDTLSPGKYIYKITAWDESGANKEWSKPFTVKENNVVTTKKKASMLKINIGAYPTTINEGKAFNLTGTVTSNYKLTSVNGYILKSDGETILYAGYDKQNKYSVDIQSSVVNKNLLFDKLEPGSYIYKVTAWDESGANREWSKPFTVKGNTTDEGTPKKSISDGTYIISSKLNSNYVVDISGASKDNGANVQLWGNNGSTAQTFNVTYVGDGCYQIKNTNSGKVLDSQDGKTTAGTNVWQYQANNTDAQKWSIVDAGGGYYYIVCKKSGLYLDVNNANVKNGENIKLWKKNGNDAQKWKFTKVSSESIGSSTNKNESNLKINIGAYPTTINKGKAFNLTGTVTSNYKLTSVNGYILSSDGKTIIYAGYDKQNKYSVDIETSVVNKNLLFNKLSPGSYIYKVTAWDESGANRIFEKKFTVK